MTKLSKDEREAYYRLQDATRERVRSLMIRSRTRGYQIAKAIGVTASVISRFLDPNDNPKVIGRAKLDRLNAYLDECGVPKLSVPGSPIRPQDHNLISTIGIVVGAGDLSSCTLPQLLLIAALGEGDGPKPDIDMAVPIEDRSFDILPALKFIVSTKRQRCTVGDLLRFVAAQRLPAP